MSRCKRFVTVFDLPQKQADLAHLERQSSEPTFWDDPNQARQLMQQASDLRATIDSITLLHKRIGDTIELIELEDTSLADELAQETQSIEHAVSEMDFQAILSGPYDKSHAILSIHSGAGGVDSMDFAAMLLRMYLRWAERRGLTVELADESEGDVAGLKSVTLIVSGAYAYGYLKAEAGVHRLVRLSPFDANHRRHTSFVLVEALPEVDDARQVEINPNDLRIDVYRAGGAGGQNVQKNSNAVRITHIPTGIVTTCQNERSQAQNKENAMKVLRARLFEIELRKRQAEIDEIKGDYVKAEWGSQIRSYVLHPYQMVKDHRTEHETGNTQAVLDGDLDAFIETYLRQTASIP